MQERLDAALDLAESSTAPGTLGSLEPVTVVVYDQETRSFNDLFISYYSGGTFGEIGVAHTDGSECPALVAEQGESVVCKDYVVLVVLVSPERVSVEVSYLAE